MARKHIKIKPFTKTKHKRKKAEYWERQARTSHGIRNNLTYVIQEAWSSGKLFLLSSIVIVLTQAAENLSLTYVDKYVVELALGSDSRIKLALLCLMLVLGTRLFRWCWKEGERYEEYVGVFQYNSHFIRKLLWKNMTTDYENNEKAKVNDLLQKARGVTGYIMTTALRTMQKTATSAVNILAFGGILSFLHPILIPIVTIPAIAGYYINRHKMQWIWNMADEWQRFERQLEYIQQAGQRFDSAKDVRIFGMQRWFGNIFQRAFENRLEWYEQQDVWERRHDIAEYLVQVLGNFAAYVFVIWKVANGSISAGDFVLYFNSISMLSESVRQWCDNYSGYRWLSENICYIRDYYDMKEQTNRSKGKPLPTTTCEIEFRNVSYTYYKAEQPTIRNLSFTLHKGEKLALVGLNGAGKTTLIKLMCGLYTPTEGEILLNGIPVNEYHRKEYFQLFSTVFQDITTLPVSIAENIAGSKWADIDKERLYDCLRKSGLYDKVMSLPKQENTRLGRSLYEDATDLSGGQAQKLALAKALYKNAPVLLLDEPTAALDPIAEQEMYLNYAEFSKGKSSVFISHRLSSTRFCDRILLIADGQIAEEGTHEQLMAQNSTYAELFRMQSNYYNDRKDGETDETT